MTDAPPQALHLTRSDVEAAHERVRPVVRRTPVVEIDGDEIGVAARVVLKLELLQHTGSFKARGALNSVLRAGTERGVAAVSGGNHAAAVAWAATRARLDADVFVPSTATPEKIERIRGYGGRAHIVEGGVPDAFAAGVPWAAEHGVHLIHPFEQVDTMCGQGTLGLELEEQVPDADAVLVACGGGGLYSGLRTAIAPAVRVVPVEPQRCANLHAALAAGRPVPVEVGGVAADSLGPAEIGATAFQLARADGIEVPLVSDDDIVAARRWLWQRCRVLAEPGGCTALAALMSGAYVAAPGAVVAVVVSGGNNPTIP